MGSVTLGFLSRPKTEFSEEVVDKEGRQAGRQAGLSGVIVRDLR